MEQLAAPEYWLGRFVLERFLAASYVVAFCSSALQFRHLLGDRGLLPAGHRRAHASWRRTPSLFNLFYSDALATGLAWAGCALAVALFAGIPQRGPLWVTMGAWLTLWVLYLSFVNAGHPFYGFVWETLLLEAGLLAVFLGNSRTAPPLLVLFCFRWLLFRLEVGAGLIKLRNDRAWRDLSALAYHHETQPIPGPLSWYFHHLPRRVHALEAVANHLAQLVVPFLLFTPQPVAAIAAGVVIATQLWLVLSGNFAWLNLLTIGLAFAAVPDAVLDPLLPIGRPDLDAAPAWFDAAVIGVTVVVAALSVWPVRNMCSRRQVMNRSFNPVHFVNTYGLFGYITRQRMEVVIEGTASGEIGAATEWREYELKAKPGAVDRRPRQVAPYHLRLDWMMWFVALSPAYGEGWVTVLLARLLEGDRTALRLLGTNPFAGEPPRFVRARLYRYRFTTPAERRATGAWWFREPVGVLVPPVKVVRPATAPG